jgi:predicted RNA-binding protein Jag
MSDSQVESAAIPSPASSEPIKREAAAKLVEELLERMEMSARIESKDVEDGSIALALHFEQPVPGLQPGRRSAFVDSLQFVANKMLNRPGALRRWIALGVNAFPEPRPPRVEKPREVSAPVANGAPKGPRVPPAPPRRADSIPPEETPVEISEDAELTASARALAESSGRLGRYYAVVAMKSEDRARLVRGASGSAGVRVTVEGEGRNRRVVFTPDKPSAMPRQRLPGIVEEEEP